MNKKYMQMLALAFCYLIILLPITSAIRVDNIQVTNIKQREATVQYLTDEPAVTSLTYGTSLSLENEKTSPLGTNHNILVDNLESDTRYFFQVRATTPAGNTIINNNQGQYFTIQTPPPLDTSKPVISNILLSGFTQSSTTVQWETDDASTSTVWYGETSFESVTELSLVQNHQLRIQTGADQLYRFIVQSCNNDGYCANSTEQSFKAGPNQQALQTTFNVPKKASSNVVTITGTTSPSARIVVRVNDREVRRAQADETGKVNLRNVPLSNLNNKVELRVTDLTGREQVETYDVSIDGAPPQLRIIDFKQVSRTGTLNLVGKINEPANVSIYVNVQEDTLAPRRVTGTTVQDIRPNTITLSWDRNEETDVKEYAIYRDNTLMGTAQANRFTDSSAPPGQLVNYRISAVDNSCNEGAQSNALEVRVPAEGSLQQTTPVSLQCKKAAETFFATGDFTRQIPLNQGINDIKVIAEDDAGNTAIFSNQTIFDNAPPTVEHNLDAVSPTYIPEVTIEGKASERVSILIYVDGESKPSITEVTGDDGSFSIDVDLPRGKAITERVPGTQGSSAIEPGQGFLHSVKLEAVDVAGNKYTSRETQLVHAFCGFGSTFSVDVQQPKPDMINPRLILEGFGQVGFNVNVSYTDIQEFSFRGQPAVYIRPLSREDQQLFDTNVLLTPKWKMNPNGAQGYVQINMETPSFADDLTLFDKLNNISMRNAGKCKHGIKQLGCLKVPLMLELRAVKTSERTPEGIEVSNQLGPQTQEIIQKTCIDVEVNIDQAIDPEVIHDGFLETSVEAMNAIIDAIDSILEPLETIFKVTLYTCLAGFAVMFILDIIEVYQCDISPVISGLSGDGFNPKIAKSGLCNHPEQGYGNADSDVKEACQDCQDAVQRNKDWSYYITWVCDRVYCPSAPSIQKYVRDSGKLEDVTNKVENKEASSSQTEEASDESGIIDVTVEDIFSFQKGNDCAAPYTNKANKDKKIETNYEGAKLIYDTYLEHEDDEVDESEIFSYDEPNCNNLHPATGDCCGYQYMEEYDSACIFMDELKESKCAIADIEGQDDEDCSQIMRAFNAAAGLCESDGTSPGTLVATDLIYSTQQAEADDATYYLFVETSDGDTPEERRTGRKVYGGYARSKKSVDKKLDVTSDLISVTTQTGITKDHDYSDFFRREKSLVEADCRNKEFYQLLRQKAGNVLKSRTQQNMEVEAEKACLRAANAFPEGKDYIVDPTSGFLRSLQCGCIAGVNSYLNLYRNVVAAVRDCFNTIALTGDGSEGQCQAVLSTYICDLIYELISCVVKYTDLGVEGEANAPFDSITGVLKSLTSAGTQTQSRISNRYGGTAMFGAMFGEKKLVHSICLFAFTGTWSLDISGLLDSGIPPVPIDSTVLVYPAERRFVSFDLTSQPPGLATWNYHIGLGVVAGADLTQRMFLKCSADYSCDPLDGYSDGRCDCLRTGEKRTPVALKQGQVRGNERYTEDIFINIGPTGAADSNIRYDKVVYEYEYKDNNDRIQKKAVEQKIGLRGGDPPAFCQYDLLTATFRCTIDIGNERYAKFSGLIRPAYSAEGESFGQFKLGENIAFNVPILQRVNDDCNSPPCADTKYLIYKIRHGSTVLSKGTTLMTNDPHVQDPRVQGTQTSKYKSINIDRDSEMLSFNGEKIVSVSPSELILTQDMLQTTSGGSTVDDNPNVGVVSATGARKEPMVIIIQNLDAKVYNSNDRNYEPPAGTVPIGQFDIGPDATRIIFDGVTLNFGETVKKKMEDNYVGKLKLLVKPSSTSNQCTAHTTTPLTLQADFEIRDTDQKGRGIYEPSTVISVDAEGKRQTQSVSFKVICSNTYAQTAESKKASRDVCVYDRMLSSACVCGTKEKINELLLGSDPANCGTPATGNYCTEAGVCEKRIYKSFKAVVYNEETSELTSTTYEYKEGSDLEIPAGKTYQFFVETNYPVKDIYVKGDTPVPEFEKKNSVKWEGNSVYKMKEGDSFNPTIEFIDEADEKVTKQIVIKSTSP